ncbi:hypothetical protein [Deminuibacter soli]|uniref:hypothetical protein n=1 Tax=Deminuibacter soli TaxID=2291815 RepID=UPI0013143484|nr:hypothetical protein [Deminuibacter soli]
MKESLAKKIADYKARAKALGDTGIKPASATQNGSSLHKIIKTPEQAAALMKALNSTL